MSRVIRLNEENLHSLIKNIISEIKKDINQPLWNVYRLPSKIGANGYAISSNFDERTLLNQLIAFGKNKWKEGKTVVSVQDEDGSGYLFKYIITLITKSVLENPDIVKSKMGFTKYIAENFDSVVQVNEEPLTKADAEMMKREIANSDPNSFKRKGAAIFRELERAGVQKKNLKKLTQNFQDTIQDLYSKDALQYKLKRIPNDSKIYRTITSVLGITPKKIIKQKV